MRKGKGENMKRWITVLGLILCLNLFAGCAGESSAETNTAEGGGSIIMEQERGSSDVSHTDGEESAAEPAAAQEETGIICRVIYADDLADTDNGMLLLAKKDGNSGDVYRVGLSSVSVIDENGNEISGDEIKSGSMLEVVFNGNIEETFPAGLGGVTEIRVREKEFDDLCTLYLNVLEDLWEVDSGLNSDITMAGMDLSGTSLSPAEQSAVSWHFGEIHGLEMVQGTFEELKEWGYIDKEELYFEDGCLFSITEKGTEEKGSEKEITFEAEKWRSGLGAYYFLDCTSRQNKTGQWEMYERGADAIA